MIGVGEDKKLQLLLLQVLGSGPQKEDPFLVEVDVRHEPSALDIDGSGGEGSHDSAGVHHNA